MKYTFLLIVFFAQLSFYSVAKTTHDGRHKNQARDQPSLPRIAIAGIAIESSTFSPARTDEAAFHAQYGKEILTRYPFFANDSPMLNRAIWIPTIAGHALPGGAVTRKAYESLVTKTLDSLKKASPLRRTFFRHTWRYECCGS